MCLRIIGKLILIILIYLMPSISLSQDVQIPLKDLKFKSKTPKKVFLKKVDYFKYNSTDFIVDSIDLKDKKIKLNLRGESGLFLISDNKSLPRTFVPFIEFPGSYNYILCSNFYTPRNFIYLSGEYAKEELDFIKWFYKNFSKNTFNKKLSTKTGYKKVEKKAAKEIIEKRKNWFKNKLDVKSKFFSNNFINYINTEIELGARNQYLNWYEEIYENQIISEICSKDSKSEHEITYKQYFLKEWDLSSIQYFKFIERIVNYKVSKEKCDFKIYHQESKVKIKIAEQFLSGKTLEKYKKL